MSQAITPIRVTFILTHPAQYFAPWFRHIAVHCPEIALMVLYATRPTEEQQGEGFGQAFSWDTDVLSGYPNHVVRPMRPGESVGSDRFRALDVKEIGQAIAETKPDVAVLFGWHSITQWRALRECRRLRVPVLYRGDTHLGNAPKGWRRWAWKLRARHLLGKFSGYLSVGSKSRDYLLANGAAACRVHPSPHCVDNKFFATSAAVHQSPVARAEARRSLGLPEEAFVVLFVGKLQEVKRPLDVMEALAEIDAPTALLVVGTGALEESCRARAKELGVMVSWAGFRNQSELGRVYAVADCLVLPSESETWGLVVNEAMAAGLPCVVSDGVGCGPDLIIPGETGEIFRRGDIASLTAALSKVRQRWKGGHDFGAACREQAARHSLTAATIGLLAACRNVRKSSSPRVIACFGSMVAAGGLEKASFAVLKALQRDGAAIHCIVNRWENHRIVPMAEALGASWSTGYYWQDLTLRGFGARRVWSLAKETARTGGGLLRQAWRFRPTHVFLPEHHAVLRNVMGLALLRLIGVRVILRVGNAPTRSRASDWLWRNVVGRLANRVISNSRHSRDALRAIGLPAERLGVIHNGAPEIALESSARDPMRIIFIGQVIPEKGLDLLLDALGILVARGLDVRLDVVGEMSGWIHPSYGDYRQRLHARATMSDLLGRVRFLGQRNDVPKLLAEAGLHACPSRPEMHEGLPNVVLEAKQAGLPTVAFAHGPFPEVIAHESDGWLAEKIDAECLAQGLAYFLVDPDRARRAGEAAKLSTAAFDPETFAERWRDEFALGRRRCRAAVQLPLSSGSEAELRPGR